MRFPELLKLWFAIAWLVEASLLPAQVPNDSFDAATDLGSAAPVTYSGTTVGAGYSWPEPFGKIDHESELQVVWFEWTPPDNGKYFIEPSWTSRRGRLELYSGESIDGLRSIPLGYYGEFDGIAGEAIKIWVATETEGSFELDIKKLTPGLRPPNDDFANRIAMPAGTESTVSGTTRLATLEPGETYHFESVWYSWVAPVDGIYTIEGSLTADIYQGDTLEGLRLVLFKNFGLETIRAEAGEVFQIAVTGRSSAPDFTLGVNLMPEDLIPTNDDFSDAIDLGDVGSVSIDGTVLGATTEIGESWLSGSYPLSIWYRWTAPMDGEVAIETSGSDRVIAFTGDHIEGLKPVAEALVFMSNGLTFACEQGQAYSIAVRGTGYSEPVSTFSLTLTPTGVTGPPENDDFESATDLGSLQGGDFSGNSHAASRQIGEPGSSDRTTWWQWTSPFTGEVEVTRVSAYQSVPVDAYRGDLLAGLEKVPELRNEVWEVAAGERYWFQIGRTPDSTYRLRIGRAEPDDSDVLSEQAFIDRQQLPGGESESIDGTLVSAPKSYGGDPAYDPDGYPARWFEWRAPADGIYRVRCGDGFFGPYGVVYTGTRLGELEYIAGGRRSPSFLFATMAGQTYLIAVKDRFGSSSFTLTLERQGMPPVAGDSILDPIDLGSVAGGHWTLHNVGAGLEEGDPGRESPPGASSIWVKWTAPSAGFYRFDTIRRIYLTAENFVGGDPESLEADPSFVLAVSAGEVRYIKLSNSGTITRNGQGGFGLQLSQLPPGSAPVNDDFANAQPLPSDELVDVRGTVSYATREGDDPAGSPHTTWWRWVAPSDGLYSLSYSDGAAMTIYTGLSLNDLEQVSSAAQFGRSPVSFPAETGVTYHIRAASSGFGEVAFGIGKIGDRLPNDSFSDAIDLGDGIEVCWTSTPALGAGLEADEPTHRSSDGGSNISTWTKWQAPADGLVEVISSSNDIKLAVYEGSSLAELVVAGGLDQTQKCFFKASVGKLYHFARFDLSMEDAIVSLRLGTIPIGNDDFLNADSLPAIGAVEIVKGNWTATGEAGEPIGDDGPQYPNSLWWSWIAPVDGPTSIDFSGSSFVTAGTIYRGASLAELEMVGSNAGGSPASFQAQAGICYHIAISALDRNFGTARFNLWQAASLPPYESWLQDHPELSGAAATRRADLDEDGFTNLVELALGLDPLSPDVALSPVADGDQFAIFFSLDPVAMSAAFGLPIEVVAESSADLISWEELPIDALGKQNYRASVPDTSGRNYLRLKVTDPNAR